jgi:hypothetical protein
MASSMILINKLSAYVFGWILLRLCFILGTYAIDLFKSDKLPVG